MTVRARSLIGPAKAGLLAALILAAWNADCRADCAHGGGSWAEFSLDVALPSGQTAERQPAPPRDRLTVLPRDLERPHGPCLHCDGRDDRRPLSSPPAPTGPQDALPATDPNVSDPAAGRLTLNPATDYSPILLDRIEHPPRA